MRSIVLASGLFFQCSAHAQTYLVTEEQNGKAVEMAVGDTLEVVLNANPTTGYSWNVTSPLGQWLVLSNHKHKPSSSMCGAPGLSSYYFVAISPGECDLSMAYAKSWEKDVPPIKTFSVPVHIEQKQE
jgi:inhibitor of cysteine peptidase